jgi:hypothetical protein
VHSSRAGEPPGGTLLLTLREEAAARLVSW